MGSLTWWISSWQVILLNFSLLVPIKNYFDRSLTLFWYMHMEFLISLTQLEYFFVVISGFFYCSSHIKVNPSTYHVFINNSVLSFHFIFQRSHCSIQAIKTKLCWKSVPLFVSQKKIPSADCLSPGQPLHPVGFWSTCDLMCTQAQRRLLSGDWCLTQQAKVRWPGGARTHQV